MRSRALVGHGDAAHPQHPQDVVDLGLNSALNSALVAEAFGEFALVIEGLGAHQRLQMVPRGLRQRGEDKSKVQQRLLGFDRPERGRQHIQHIQHVMLGAAVARAASTANSGSAASTSASRGTFSGPSTSGTST